MSLPRWWHHLHACVAGYFWAPCPRCGRYFGGHEEHGGDDWYPTGEGRICCEHCPGDRTLVNGEWREGYWIDTARQVTTTLTSPDYYAPRPKQF